ncbi:efflux RND transporter permease subunit [Echinicola soli]|uniref:Efflux RND transporter permease subunit n=1 Tax=Echinicola soli TaxID=2591634 RepID=A0A514CJ31_9BACT|nr:efflux RND transporter permease subunit [Echinicola soli]QDH79644.1 efflux RND transporter permease subunit [Echinicola soli]
MLNAVIKFFLENKLVTVLLLVVLVAWGLVVVPFQWNTPFLPSDPVPVDAIPDLGENQQIVFTEWMGQSPQDIEDQVTYPLTTSLLGLPGVKSIRSTSMFGLSSIYIIFDDDIEYYWSRSRILEKLNSLASNLLPAGVQPKLGPDATALGQVYWYTLEGRDQEGKPAGGWDLHELRSIQDYYVRYGLAGVEGVAEVASVGGMEKEYQVDLDPEAMKVNGVSMMDVREALQSTNQSIGANTLEINKVEYYVRALGFVENIQEIEETVVKAADNVPLRIKDIAKVTIGPADRAMKGILDKSGAEAVGGVVVARYGDNPMEVIKNVKAKIEAISAGLPEKKLEDGSISKVTIVPFYDRSNLILETLATLNDAIFLQILMTIVVVMVMVYNLRASLLISAILPLAVLTCFIFMKYAGVDANIVALSGIAIAIGTMVDLGIILNENILRHMDEAPGDQSLMSTVYNATKEVATAILTAVATTIVSFLPVFTLQAAEGKLFGPLAYTKTFALLSALLFTLLVMPAFAHWIFGIQGKGHFWKKWGNMALVLLGALGFFWLPLAGMVLMGIGINNLLFFYKSNSYKKYHTPVLIAIAVLAVSWLLATAWAPLGASVARFTNFLFVLLIVGIILGIFGLFIRYYEHILNWCLANKGKFLMIPALMVFVGLNSWIGFAGLFGWAADGFDRVGWNIRTTAVYSSMVHTFPGMGEEFMPALDEGSFLLMPTSMPHSGVEANKKILQQLDMLVTSIPEVSSVVGKAGRAETPLDPAPMSMFENVILYKPEFKVDENGRKRRFAVNEKGEFLKDEEGQLIPDDHGEYYRQWRNHIKSPDDIWNEITKAAKLPGVTSAPKLQPIETRLLMLQTGMRAPIGLKVYGPDLETIADFSIQLEKYLKEVPGVKPAAVFADRSLGKPYLEIDLDRRAIARYGLQVKDVQETISAALGGVKLTTTVEGRERFAIRARYARDFRQSPEAIENLLLSGSSGVQVPLKEMAEIQYRQGPMMIRSEDSFLVGYVLLDKQPNVAEVTVVENAQDYLQGKIDSGELKVPGGVSYQFSGSYENQVRAEKRLSIVIPLCLMVIFLILYFQFRSVPVTLFIFSAISMAFAGAFIMLWLYGQPWFMDFEVLGSSMRSLFQMKTYNMSVAVWVGFIALFGIATDDGVVMATYLKQRFAANRTETVQEVRHAVKEAGMRRIRPCLMTSATTLLALLPVLTSSGRGSDIMIPMAIPSFGGMVVALVSLFIVPVLYSWWEERKLVQNSTIQHDNPVK